MTLIVNLLVRWIIFLISNLGYLGIIIAMAIESANIPLPSEVILPFSGFLVYQGRFHLFLVTLAGGLGCLIGSLFSWWLGKTYGEDFIRYLIRKYGKYLLIFEYELDDAIKLFDKYGDPIIFFSRLLPIVRTFISLPAGIAQMNVLKFSLYTLTGSLIWSLFLTWIGFRLGDKWHVLAVYFHRFDALIITLFFILVIFYFWHKIKRYKEYKKEKELRK